jgi:hypothetical protein
MQLKILTIGLVASAFFASTNLGLAADAPIRKKTVVVERVAGDCRHDRCRSRCPDRYSCSPLYGAYGPWGGEPYWAAYSYTFGY